VPTPEFAAVRATLMQSLQDAIVGVPIVIELVDEIPASTSGKHHTVIFEAA
jgi:hypothetical protein